MPYNWAWFHRPDQSFARESWIRLALLQDPAQTNSEVARLCDVTHYFVAKARAALETAGTIAPVQTRTGRPRKGP
jgi:hypothetical protein